MWHYKLKVLLLLCSELVAGQLDGGFFDTSLFDFSSSGDRRHYGLFGLGEDAEEDKRNQLTKPVNPWLRDLRSLLADSGGGGEIGKEIFATHFAHHLHIFW